MNHCRCVYFLVEERATLTVQVVNKKIKLTSYALDTKIRSHTSDRSHDINATCYCHNRMRIVHWTENTWHTEMNADRSAHIPTQAYKMISMYGFAIRSQYVFYHKILPLEAIVQRLQLCLEFDFGCATKIKYQNTKLHFMWKFFISISIDHTRISFLMFIETKLFYSCKLL